MHEWDGWANQKPIALGNPETYAKAIAWLDGHGDILDFGGGTGYAERFVTRSRYFVIDGSLSVHVTTPVDLAHVDVQTECVLMRHVLEHNFNWIEILENMLRSFAHRASIVTFLPFVRWPPAGNLLRLETGFIGYNGINVPVIQLCDLTFTDLIGPYLVDHEAIGNEKIFYLEKKRSR